MAFCEETLESRCLAVPTPSSDAKICEQMMKEFDKYYVMMQSAGRFCFDAEQLAEHFALIEEARNQFRDTALADRRNRNREKAESSISKQVQAQLQNLLVSDLDISNLDELEQSMKRCLKKAS